MKNLTFEIKENGLGWLEWDQPHSSVNLFSLSFIEELESFINQVEKNPLKALILVSKKPLVFCAGADVKALQKFQTEQDISGILAQVHKLFFRFEKLPFFKIAAISGTCLGAGLEWVLCFDYRLSAYSSSIKIGLPEVHLGLIPGFGGCLRLPRLIGLKKSLPLILKGKSLNPSQALQAGLLNEIVPPSLLNRKALDLAEEMAEKKYSPQQYYKDLNPYWFFIEKTLKNILCFLARKQILKKTRHFYPAPLKALEVIQKTFARPVTLKNLKTEKIAFFDLYQSQISKNLIRVFLLIDKAKRLKPDNTVTLTQQKMIKHIGVLGAGTMGRAIAYLFADRGFKVRLMDNNQQHLLNALAWMDNLWQQQKGQIDNYELQKKTYNLSVSTNFWGVSTLDLVIEALPEDKSLKQKVIARVSKMLNPSCFFASNSSSLCISDLAKSSLYPNNFFGLHFFYPAHKMRLVEISLTEKQSEFPLSSMRQILKQLNKVPLFVKDSPGFIVNRLLSAFLTEVLFLYDEGHDIEEIDRCYREILGMNLGPFQLMDQIGLDTCVNALSNFKSEGLQIEAPHWAEKLNDLLGSGKKSGTGFYTYIDGNQNELNQDISNLNRISYPSSSRLTCKKIIQRGIYRMIREGQILIKNKIAESEEEIDLAMILGTGFPPFLGGPMHYAYNIGWIKIKKQMEEFEKAYGERFQL